MFRSSTTIRELTLNLDKIIFMLKLSVKLLIYYAVVWQHVMEWRVCCMQHTRISYFSVFEFFTGLHLHQIFT